MTLVTPLRFVSGVIGLWTAARVAVLMPDLLTPPAEADTPAPRTRQVASAGERAVSLFPSGAQASPAGRQAVFPFITGPVDVGAGPSDIRLAGFAPGARRRLGDKEGARFTGLSPDALPLSPTGSLADFRTPAPPPVSPSGLLTAPVSASPAQALAEAGGSPIRAAASSRLSGSLYLFHRGDGAGNNALATGGQLGGSQAGGRVAWALNSAGPPRLATVARFATPLDDARGAEGAAGIDLYPLPGRPLRLSVERRVDLGGRGRNAWSAYAAGGFWQPLKGGLVADGYAQAGVVGVRRGDLFADGALRLGHRRELGEGHAITLGGGVWGAAQPGVSRLDVGPRAAFSFPLAGTSVTAAAEWRVRVSGGARPGSGLALTLASDF